MTKVQSLPSAGAPADEADESSVQRIVPARGAARPITNAPNSVFDAGRQAQAATEAPTIALERITIREGVPKPPAAVGKPGYRTVIERMQPGDSVELPSKQARGFYAQAKKHGSKAAPPPSSTATGSSAPKPAPCGVTPDPPRSRGPP